MEVQDLDTQFHDGVYLTLLMGLLEGFFVPLYSFNLYPQSFEQKVHNVHVAFDLMQEIGLAAPKARPEGNSIFLYKYSYFFHATSLLVIHFIIIT